MKKIKITRKISDREKIITEFAAGAVERLFSATFETRCATGTHDKLIEILEIFADVLHACWEKNE